MATTELSRLSPRELARGATADDFSLAATLRSLTAPLASLRLTVALLALSLVLVLAGTLAQIDYDVWKVVHEYFRTWIAWIELKIFLPRSYQLPAWAVFPFPGGKLLGTALAINLFAAHAVRFKIAAKGGRLLGGLLLIAIGAVLTYAVIASGANTAIESELSAEFTNGLWHALRAGVGAAALALAYALALTYKRASQSSALWLWCFGVVVAAIGLSVAVWLFLHPEARLNPSGLRILWQLAKAGGASIVLGLGCWAVFSKRAGIVLLHSGIALLMLSELYTAERAVESQMRIAQGQTVSYAEDMRTSELAITDFGDSKTDRVTVVPRSLLEEAFKSKKPIELPDLPFNVRLVEYFPNALARLRQPGEEAVATAGQGQLRTLEARPQSTGVATEQSFDIPAAYVELISKKDKKSRGVFLVSPLLPRTDVVTEDGVDYELALRFKRVPKDYTVTLEKFTFDRYEGSETPKNFESLVRFQDPRHKVDVTVPIWMNNPLRYAGDTLYQADWDRETETGTVLQVVTNSGWMIPYVSCMIVLAGMLVHFGQAIVRFLSRREDEARRAAVVVDQEAPDRWRLVNRSERRWTRWEVIIPAVVLVTAAGWVAMRARPPHERVTEMKLHEFGRLPAAHGGRTLPLDTLASNTLRIISGRETYDDARFKKRQPAIRWLLDVVSDSRDYLDHKVVRVEHLEVLKALKLKPREGYRYSLAELHRDVTANNEGELRRQTALAAAVPEGERNSTQQKFLETSAKANRIFALRQAFAMPDFGASLEEMVQRKASIEATIRELNRAAPRVIPPATPHGPWSTLYEATYNMIRTAIVSSKKPAADDPASQWIGLLEAYQKGEVQQFNNFVAEYGDSVAKAAAEEEKYEDELAAAGQKSPRKPAERLMLERIEFEAFFNNFSPFILCLALYVAAFVLAAVAWLGWFEGFNRTANWLLWLTFALHTFGLICRIYISGRPPVTNLYSSAVFVGWAGVLFGLLFEAIFKLGVGNLLAAAIGFPTMLIAFYLTFDNDGDTVGVMQAVLDTNFWLGTHVVCMTLGMAATLMAGLLGLSTLVMGLLGVHDAYLRRQLNRMTYGALCFAIFFSFIGTVLGGLWADDSWGRFWGWDPKENGALMIVLWNALVLHARWGKIVGERGLAALAVIGNIVTAWSWFGVNQMGVGLHAYGFTEGRTLTLALFMLSQLAIVAGAYATDLFRRRRVPALVQAQ
jgi:ABC-type transport system involved in cytochrome c biogenesis permease subunit